MTELVTKRDYVTKLPDMYGREHFPEEWDVLKKKYLASHVVAGMDDSDKPADAQEHAGTLYSPSDKDMFNSPQEIDRWDAMFSEAGEYMMDKYMAKFHQK